MNIDKTRLGRTLRGRGALAFFLLLLGLATSTVLAVGISPANAMVVVGAAPTWPIPADAPPGPPSIPDLPAADDTPPPADQIADPVTAGADCGGWELQNSYAGRWAAGSSWWEYRCSEQDAQYHDTCLGPACNAFCPDCYWETQSWIDYFVWDGSNALFYGELYADSVAYDSGDFSYSSADWWDAPTPQWYHVSALPLSVLKDGTGSGVVSSSPAGISCGDTCFDIVDAGSSVALTATPDASSVFAGWSGDCWGTDVCQVTMDQARTVAATFIPKQFTLTVAAAGSGSGLVYMSPGATGCRSCRQSFEIGTNVTLTAAPDASSLFTGWSGDCSGSGACQVTMDQARSVTAIFALTGFGLNVAKTGTGSGQVSSTPSGIACGNSCSANYEVGQTVTLTAIPDPSSIFAGWSGDCSGAGTCEVTMDQYRSVTAAFAPKAFILMVSRIGSGSGAVTSSPAGISCGYSCQASFDAGSVVNLTASADDTSDFIGWSGDCSGTGSCQMTMDQARSVTATFVQNTPPFASFTVTCTGLTCTFDAGGSADGEGTISGYAWSLGDGTTGNGKTISHVYPKAGSYTLTLTVTDNAGASATTSRRINPISVSARGFKQNGQQKVELAWNGVVGTSFDVYRDGGKIVAVQATTYTDVAQKGPGTHAYRVCVADAQKKNSGLMK
jgi:hypothetical protein